MEQDDQRSGFRSADHMMEPHSVGRRIAMLELRVEAGADRPEPAWPQFARGGASVGCPVEGGIGATAPRPL